MDRGRDVIRSRTNPLVQRFRAQKDHDDQGLALVEGWRLLEEALSAGIVVEHAVLSAAIEPRGGRAEIVSALRERGVDVRLVDPALLDQLSEVETSQGVLALVRRPVFDEAALFRGVPLVVVAVGLQNPGNVGGLLRTAEAAGASGAYLTQGTADPLSPKALRGSMGSAFRLPHVRRRSASAALARAHEQGLAIVAASSHASAPYDAVDLTGPTALVLGSEGAGLPEEVLGGAEVRVSIPMGGPVESLNVGVAAGVLLFEAARQRRSAPRRP